MKRLKLNKYVLFGLGLLITGALFLLGQHGHDTTSPALATAGAVITLTEAEKEGLNEQEQKVALAMKKLVKQSMEDYNKGIMSKAEIEGIVSSATKEFKESFSKEELVELKTQLTTMKEAAIEQGRVIAELKLTNTETGKETLINVIEKNKEGLSASTKKGKDYEFTIKADTLRASVVGNPAALDLTDVGQLAYRKLTVYDLFRKVPVPAGSNGVIRYVDWDDATKVRAAAAIAEGGTFPESTAKWATYTLQLQKVGDIIPVSEEVMYDAPLFAAELKNFLETNVAIKVDTDLITGNGTSPNINGLKNQVPNYTAVAAGITDASIYDLLVKVRETITASYGSKYNPDVALMNITDINKMKLKKDTHNNYIMPPFFDRNGQQVDGVSVIECNAVAANTMIVGDRRYGAIYEEPGVTVNTGFATGDFESDMMSLKARRRLNLLIREVDKTGWLEVTSISAALVTLAT